MLPTEMQVLALAGLLWSFLYVWAAVEARRDLGGWPASPADTARAGSLASRLGHAMADLQPSFILYLAAAILITLTDRASAFTGTLDWTWLLARLALVLLSVFDWRGLQPIAWGISVLATLGLFILAGF
jgi:uncharacterized MAPEG superfamily protein